MSGLTRQARPVPPEKPLPTDCCGSGCDTCVLDQYEIEVERYNAVLVAWEQVTVAALAASSKLVFAAASSLSSQSKSGPATDGKASTGGSTTSASGEAEPIAEDDSLLALSPTEWRDIQVTAIEQVNHNTRLFRLAAPSGKRFRVPIGRHVQARHEFDGRMLMRFYTPISVTDDCIKLLIKTYPEGRMSAYFHHLSPGDTVSVRGPKGRFSPSPDTRGYLMIAGGSGLTPMLQLLHHLADTRPPLLEHVTFIYSNTEDRDVLLREQLDALPRDVIRVQYWISSKQGRLNADALLPRIRQLSVEAEGLANAQVLICGSTAMSRALKTMLKGELNVPPDSIVVF